MKIEKLYETRILSRRYYYNDLYCKLILSITFKAVQFTWSHGL